MTKAILCNWCGKKHAQPAQSAAEYLAHCGKKEEKETPPRKAEDPA